MLMNSACKDYEKFHFIPPLQCGAYTAFFSSSVRIKK